MLLLLLDHGDYIFYSNQVIIYHEFGPQLSIINKFCCPVKYSQPLKVQFNLPIPNEINNSNFPRDCTHSYNNINMNYININHNS